MRLMHHLGQDDRTQEHIVLSQHRQGLGLVADLAVQDVVQVLVRAAVRKLALHELLDAAPGADVLHQLTAGLRRAMLEQQQMGQTLVREMTEDPALMVHDIVAVMMTGRRRTAS